MVSAAFRKIPSHGTMFNCIMPTSSNVWVCNGVGFCPTRGFFLSPGRARGGGPGGSQKNRVQKQFTQKWGQKNICRHSTGPKRAVVPTLKRRLPPPPTHPPAPLSDLRGEDGGQGLSLRPPKKGVQVGKKGCMLATPPPHFPPIDH